MLSEIEAITQLILVLEVAYLMFHCRKFQKAAPDILYGVEERHNTSLETATTIASIMDEIADGIVGEGSPINSQPFDFKQMLTGLLMSKIPYTPEHAPQDEQENWQISEIDQTQEKTEIEFDGHSPVGTSG